MKAPSLTIQKIMANVKVFCRQTDREHAPNLSMQGHKKLQYE